MKKTMLAFAVSALMVAGAAQAAPDANDQTATLSVSGSVTKQFSCAVNLSTTSVNINSDITDLKMQGLQNVPTDTVELTVTGDTDCQDMVRQGKIAYSFHGTADQSEGNVVANSLTDSSAAQGVGIGLFDWHGTSIALNSGTLTANTNGPTQLGLDVVSLSNQQPTAGAVQGQLTIQIERL